MSGRSSTALLGVLVIVSAFSAGAGAIEKREIAYQQGASGAEREAAGALGKSAEALRNQGEWLARQGEALRQQGQGLQLKAEVLRQSEAWLTEQVRTVVRQANTVKQYTQGFVNTMIGVGQKLLVTTKDLGAWLQMQLNRLSEQCDHQWNNSARVADHCRHLALRQLQSLDR